MAPSDSRKPGRIRSLDEAKMALDVPATEEALRLGGAPFNRLVAVPVVDEAHPEIAAEFAVEIVLSPNGRELGRFTAERLPRRAEISNVWWVAYGPIVEASDGALVIGQISVAPAVGADLAREDDDAFLGMRTGLLRLLSPPRLLADAIEYLRAQDYWLTVNERSGGRAMPPAQARALERVSAADAPKSRVSEDQIAAIAEAYVTLYRFGATNPSVQIAGQFGLTREQVRDRIHRARKDGYLTPATKQGRIGAEPGPKLLAYWNPPEVKGGT